MKHPPFNGNPAAAPQRRWDDAAGAQKLAAIIRAARAKAGHDVQVIVLETMPGPPDTLYTVRMPMLINGLPARVG